MTLCVSSGEINIKWSKTCIILLQIFTVPHMILCVSSGENKNKMELNLYNSIANFTVPKGDNNLSLSLVRCTSTRVVCPTSIIHILSCVVSALSHIPENRH